MFKLRTILPIVIGALVIGALIFWPSFVNRRIAAARIAALPTYAPVSRDYLDRGKYVAIYERGVRENHPGDMMMPRILSEQYLQRYREQGDIGDVFRAEAMAKKSLAVMPRHNLPAEAELAGVDLTLHRFKEALAITKHIESYDPGDVPMLVREGSLDLELGRYAAAKHILDRLPPSAPYELATDTFRTRYEELTGDLADARTLFERPTAYANSAFASYAQSRSWFYFRSGELAFEAGDNDAALDDEAQALATFPNDVDASRAKARFECALHRWSDCLKDAQFSANIIPYPETLGYEADAQKALGDSAASARTNDLIRAVERIGNAQHISDRLLAIYYSDHGLYPADAYAIAKRELAVRDDIFTEDTLAWAAAMDGRWDEARTRIARAIRFDTENSVMQYHAGAIALHFGDKTEAKRRFTRALALNPQFHETYADDARARLAGL